MSPKHLEDMYDAVIVGAGAAGLSAALGLLRSPEITELKEQGVDPKILAPRDTYADASEWENKAKDLASRFEKNFVKYTGNDAGKALAEAGPHA